MPATISLNPVLQTNAAGSFFVTSSGYVQGVLLDDPVTRFKLNQGIVSPTATLPMWGGIGVTVNLWNPAAEAPEVQFVLTPATALANLNGFTVFNQAAAMVQTAQSQVPVAGATMSINFVFLGSGARICLAASAAVAAGFENAPVNTPVYWDFTNQVVLATGTGAIPCKVVDVNVGGSQTVTYNAATNMASWNRSGALANTVVIEI
jgi:hypothetical protein